MARMPCAECNHGSTLTVDTRPSPLPFPHIWRRRKCEKCGHKFSTREIVATSDELYGFMAE